MRKFVLFLTFFTFCFGLISCKPKNSGQKTTQKANPVFSTPPKEVPQLKTNNLSREPSVRLRSFADSTINRQPYSSESLTFAEDSHKLIFLLLLSPDFANSLEFPAHLETFFADKINQNFVPILADTTINPELTNVAAVLSSESNQNINFPFIIWMTHEGNPFQSNIVGSLRNENEIKRRFSSVIDVFIDDKNSNLEDIITNSRNVNISRLRRRGDYFEDSTISTKDIDLKPEFFETSTLARHHSYLISLFDSTRSKYDNTGNLPPSALNYSIKLFGQSAACPTSQKREATKTVQQSVDHLSSSGLWDPLDQLFFARRASANSSVPLLSKELSTQSSMLPMLAASSSLPGTTRANELLAQLRKELAPTTSYPTTEKLVNKFLYSVEVLQNLLTEDEFNALSAACEIEKEGNVPVLDDPERKFRNLNTLSQKHYGSALANRAGKSINECDRLLLEAFAKLKKERDKRLESELSLKETLIPLEKYAGLLTSLCQTYQQTPNLLSLSSISKTALSLRDDFRNEERELLHLKPAENYREIEATAKDLAAHAEAMLWYYRVSYQNWALEEASTSIESLLSYYLLPNFRIAETPLSKSLISFPVYDHQMIFGPSTWGRCFGIFASLEDMGFTHANLTNATRVLGGTLSRLYVKNPVSYTDFFISAYTSSSRTTLLLPKDFKADSNLGRKIIQVFSKPEFLPLTVTAHPFGELAEKQNGNFILLNRGKVISEQPDWESLMPMIKKELAK